MHNLRYPQNQKLKIILMQLKHSIHYVFLQLSHSLSLLTDEEYKKPGKLLSNATIGQHVRHIIELFQCLHLGYETGIVNYDKRKRDYAIETNKNLASMLLTEICSALDKPDKPLLLEVLYSDTSEETMQVQSNYYREVVYNLEHTVHHMALIRVGVAEVSQLQLPADFGVASSTVKYRNTCAQ